MSKPKITFVKISPTWGKLICEDPAILEAAIRKFAVPVENYWFMPAYKAGRWDGKIRFVQNDGRFYIGNFRQILKYVYDDRLYEMEIDPDLFSNEKDKNVHKDTFFSNMETLDCPFAPYTHQLRGALKATYYKRGICLHVTSAGKSLTISLAIHHLLQQNSNHKILILVPKLDLVEQFVENLEEYGIPSDLIGKFCGYTKEPEAQIVVSTWQSMYKQKSLLRDFSVLVADEAHGIKSTVIRGLTEQMTNADIRLGFTGTMPDNKADHMLIQGVIGPVIDEVGYEELQKKNQIAGIKISIVNCKYDDNTVSLNESEDYVSEKDFIETNEKRNRIICRIAKEYASKDKNCLILVKKIEHAETLYELLKASGVKAHKVMGKTKIADRNETRHNVEESGGNVIVATVGVYSTGVSIKRLHSVIFASPGKSKIQTLQSVGRGLRLHDTKKNLHLYDISDNLRFSIKHLRQRVKYYKENKFQFDEKDVEM